MTTWNEHYTAGGHDNAFPWSDLVSLVRRFAPRPKLVIELGCGTGANSAIFDFETEYFGYDVSRAALHLARARWLIPSRSFFERNLEFDTVLPLRHLSAGDLVFDRATIPHLTRDGARRTIGSLSACVPGVIYIGVDWFSTGHWDREQFSDIDTVNFYTETQIRTLFSDWSIRHLEHKRRERLTPPHPSFGSFDLVAVKQ